MKHTKNPYTNRDQMLKHWQLVTEFRRLDYTTTIEIARCVSEHAGISYAEAFKGLQTLAAGMNRHMETALEALKNAKQ